MICIGCHKICDLDAVVLYTCQLVAPDRSDCRRGALALAEADVDLDARTERDFDLLAPEASPAPDFFPVSLKIESSTEQIQR